MCQCCILIAHEVPISCTRQQMGLYFKLPSIHLSTHESINLSIHFQAQRLADHFTVRPLSFHSSFGPFINIMIKHAVKHLRGTLLLFITQDLNPSIPSSFQLLAFCCIHFYSLGVLMPITSVLLPSSSSTDHTIQLSSCAGLFFLILFWLFY